MPDATERNVLPKTLGLLSLIVFGVGDMLGAGIYALIGVAAGLLGNMVWAGFLVSCIAAVLTGLSYANIGARYPKASGASFVVQRAFHSDFIAYVIGLTVLASGVASMAAASRAFARYAIGFAPELSEALIGAGFLAALALIVHRGLRESAGVNLVCTAIETAGLLFIIAIGIRFWGEVDLLDATTEANPLGLITPLLLFQGAALTFYAFMGFEDMLNVSEEVEDAERVFPVALISALLVASLLYISVSVSAVSAVPAARLAASEGPGPLVKVVEAAAPWFHSELFSVISLFAIANTALLNFVMGSRIIYGMSKQKLMPALCGRLSSRGAPVTAIAVILSVSLCLTLLGDLSDLAAATSLLLLCVFSVVNIALIVLKLRRNEPRSSFEVPLVVPVMALVISVSIIGVRVTTGTMTAVAIAVSFLAVSATLYFVNSGRANEKSRG